MIGPLVPLSKSVAEWSLSLSELSLVIFAAIVIAGLFGEHRAHPRPDPWLPASIKPSNWKPPGWNWPKIWELVVIFGIIGELIGDAGVWVSSDALQAISNHETEELRAANLKLESQIQPRHLTSEQQTALTALFANFPGSVISVISYMQDIESNMLAKQILRTVSDAKLTPHDARWRASSFGTISTGVAVTGTDAVLVASATASLKSFGLKSVSNEPVSNFMDSEYEKMTFSLKIFIAARPLPDDP